jgi:predicted Zn-dependent protease
MPTLKPARSLWQRLTATALAAMLVAQPWALAQAQTTGSTPSSRSTSSASPASLPDTSTSPPLASGSLPGLGDGSDMSIADERRLGDSIARQIYQDPDYLDDPVLVDYLQAIWQPLLAAGRARGDVPAELSERLAWELMINRVKEVNAFALPGGYMGVNLGLIAVTDSPEELASVLAHEMSHVSQRHIARMIARQARDAPWLMGAMILGALAARNSVDMANATIVGTQALAVQNQLNFSRDMEREADRVGFGVMTAAGFEGRGFVSMFDKLQQASRLNDDGAFPYLRSHPLTSERIADMHARLPLAAAAAANGPVGPLRTAPVVPRLDTGLSKTLHSLMAARARVLADSAPDRWSAWLQAGQAASAPLGERYAAALSALRLNQYPLALKLAQSLRGAVPAEEAPTVDALLIEILVAAPDGAQNPRLAALRDQALAGDSRAQLLMGAQAALATQAPQAAAGPLQSWVVGHPRDALAWQTLSRVQAATGQRLRSVRSEAEARAAVMDFEGAAARFRAAQALPAADRQADAMELAIVDVRRREVEAQLKALAREK